MLTIKVVHKDGSSITALAHSIRTFLPDIDTMPAGMKMLAKEGGPVRFSPAFPKLITYEREDGVDCSVDDGTVYVMNENGKTVDTYYLHSDDPRKA